MPEHPSQDYYHMVSIIISMFAMELIPPVWVAVARTLA